LVPDEQQESPGRHAVVIAEEYAVARDFARVTTPTERRRAFGILFVSLLCMGAGQSVIYTILPPLGRQLGLGPFQVTSIFAASALIWIFSSAFWGARSDIWGRKPVMLTGLIAFAVSFAAFASTMLFGLHRWIPVALIFPLLIASRCIYGTFGSGTSAAAQAYVADRTAPHERLHGVAIISMAFALGTTFGPVIGSALTYVALLAPFYFISALALLSAAAIYYFLPERTPPHAHRAGPSTLTWFDPDPNGGLFLAGRTQTRRPRHRAADRHRADGLGAGGAVRPVRDRAALAVFGAAAHRGGADLGSAIERAVFGCA
jgi:MFS family permease